tara:strand:- start:1510 stop:2028 length:519 start_codon:yes stop_codon:yes gene_type:complete
MMFKLSSRSLKNLKGVHPDLVAVVQLAITRTPIDFMVIEGLRTLERQKELVRSGDSRTLNSRHLTGHAVDIVPLTNGKVSWAWPQYYKLAPVIMDCAMELGVSLEWGGDWTTLKDGPHWQLSWGKYNADDMTSRRRKKLPPDVPDDIDVIDVPSPFAQIISAIVALFGRFTK